MATSITVHYGGPGPAGPQGPPGPPGTGSGGTATYTHQQIIASTVWDIEHNLGFKPAGIRVEASDGVTYWPDVDYVSDNAVRLNLPDSVNGTAHLS